MIVQKIIGCALLLTIAACGTGKKTTTSVTGLFDTQGHRGNRGLMPENTIPAMLSAIDLDVTTLEMDVVISKDKKVVLSHDVFFHENITTTPEGKFLTKAEATKRLLYEMNYDSIQKYDVGMKVHPDFPRQKKIAVHKPLLSDLLDETEVYAKNKKQHIGYNIEIKSKPENELKKHPPVEEFVDLVINVIIGKNIQSRCVIQSFDMRPLQLMHKKFPGIATSLLIENNDKRTFDQQLEALAFIPSVYSPHFSLVTTELIQQCHQKKMRIIPWTVNTIEEIKRLKGMGVDGIISDYADFLKEF